MADKNWTATVRRALRLTREIVAARHAQDAQLAKLLDEALMEADNAVVRGDITVIEDDGVESTSLN